MNTLTFTRQELIALSESTLEASEHLAQKLESEGDYTPSEIEAINAKIEAFKALGFRIDTHLYSSDIYKMEVRELRKILLAPSEASTQEHSEQQFNQ